MISEGSWDRTAEVVEERGQSFRQLKVASDWVSVAALLDHVPDLQGGTPIPEPTGVLAPVSRRAPADVSSMEKHRYRVVPFIGRVSTGIFSTDSAKTVSQQLSAAIERETSLGWEFHSLAKVDIAVTPGCFAMLFGARTSYVTFDQLILRAEDPPRRAPGPGEAGAPDATLAAQEVPSMPRGASPEERATERARGIVRCKSCDRVIAPSDRQVCREKELCEEHL